jgi:deazaflavin-dependent oxidoreductase (nitroreductase family)
MTPGRPAVLALAAVLAGTALAGRAAEPIPVSDQLLAVKDERECRLTTTGRKTGNPHTVTVWFVADGDVVYLSTLDPTRDWVRNALAHPTVTLAFTELTMRGQLRDVTEDPALDARIRDALGHKYWLARIAGWFGKGPKHTFVVDQLEALPRGAGR